MKRLAATLAALLAGAACIVLLVPGPSGAPASAASATTPPAASAAAPAAAPGPAASGRWMCPPCGAACDTIVFDAPGTCPKCGMALVAEAEARRLAADQARQAASHPAKKVAILLFDNAEIIDFTGPYEVFGTAGYDVYTVAATHDPITTAFGMTVVPKYSFADAPQPDVVLVPGGGVVAARKNQPLLAWLRETSAHAAHTLSVCNGAFILAEAGLLDGLTATTTARLIPGLAKGFPKVHVVNDQRFVDNGRIITAAGLTSGIDAALHLVSVLEGRGTAQEVALSQEYDWRPDGHFARAALADMLLPQVAMDSLGTWRTVRTEGDRRSWDIEARGTSELAPGELRARLEAQFGADRRWSRDGAGWTLRDPQGARWTGKLEVAPDGAAPHAYTLHVAIARAG